MCLRGITEDNLKLVFLFSQLKHILLPLIKNRLGETVLMMGHKMSFKGVIWKIDPKLSLLPLLIWSTGGGVKLKGLPHTSFFF